jgi:hypothetical protein
LSTILLLTVFSYFARKKNLIVLPDPARLSDTSAQAIAERKLADASSTTAKQISVPPIQPVDGKIDGSCVSNPSELSPLRPDHLTNQLNQAAKEIRRGSHSRHTPPRLRGF